MKKIMKICINLSIVVLAQQGFSEIIIKVDENHTTFVDQFTGEEIILENGAINELVNYKLNQTQFYHTELTTGATLLIWGGISALASIIDTFQRRAQCQKMCVIDIMEKICVGREHRKKCVRKAENECIKHCSNEISIRAFYYGSI